MRHPIASPFSFHGARLTGRATLRCMRAPPSGAPAL
ncbi:hypothetical protein STVIR_5543 [Streptomyces viridochromogenes Tue57]|uniref:Uncharacterized protein n=1 Tax=Streptomyces viridochromogenes Tue57 TaxID=1160705 RepID=L8PAL9_STRVR|nr:hypothetical protein STVIR_5543 [Streptomyces viridochromogenes Tue57]